MTLLFLTLFPTRQDGFQNHDIKFRENFLESSSFLKALYNRFWNCRSIEDFTELCNRCSIGRTEFSAWLDSHIYVFFFQPDFIVIHFDFSLTYTQTSTFYIAQTLIQTKIFVFLNVNIRCIWTFSAVWLFTKIAYACAKKYLSSSLTFRYWKCFVWDNHRKLKHYLEITTEMNEMTTGLGCHPSEKHSHYLQNVLFFSLDWAYFSLCDKSYQGEAFQCS